MAFLPLPHGRFAIIDACLYDELSKHNWCQSSRGYVQCAAPVLDGKKAPMIRLHRLVMNAPSGTEVDHRFGNLLDNRRSELRLCTRKQNMGNIRKKSDGKTSRYKGVSFIARDKRFVAQIHLDGKRRVVCRSVSEEEAARAYDAHATRVYGDFARLNFPTPRAVEHP